MSTFKKYVCETKREYKYTIKLAVCEVTEDHIDAIEGCLLKYKLVSATPFRNTPIQESPLDFPSVKNCAVYSSDIVLNYPGSVDFLRNLISGALNLPLSHVVIYTENDPRQVENDLFVQRTSDEFKKNYTPVLGSEPPAAENIPYGEEYNMTFLKELEKVRKEQEQTIVLNNLSQMVSKDTTSLPKNYNDTLSTDTDASVGLFGRIKRPQI